MDASEIILSSDEKAAQLETVTGWVSRRGFFFGNGDRSESSARYDGCTHRQCSKCGEIIEKNSYCRPCSAKAEVEKYKKMERRAWNGTDALYSQTEDRFFFSPEDLAEYCEDEETTPESLRLIICEPTRAHEIEPYDLYSDDLPEDGELPSDIEDAFKELNEVIRESKTNLSWSPGKYAADLVG